MPMRVNVAAVRCSDNRTESDRAFGVNAARGKQLHGNWDGRHEPDPCLHRVSPNISVRR